MALSHSSLKSAVPNSASAPGTSSTTAAHIRVALAMSSELDRMAWTIVIGKQEDMELVATAASSRQFLDMLNSHAPDVVLIDEDILNLCDHQALLARVNQSHSFRLILVAMHEPDFSMECPPCSFIHTRLLKGVSAPKLLDTIRASAKEAGKRT